MSFGLKRTSITISKLYSYLPPHKRFFTNVSNYGERHKLPSSPKATNLILMPSSLPPYLIHSSPIPTCFSNILLRSNCIIRYNLTSLPSVFHNAQIKNLSSLALTFFSLSLEDGPVFPTLNPLDPTILPVPHRWHVQVVPSSGMPASLTTYYSFRYLSCFLEKHSTPESSPTLTT